MLCRQCRTRNEEGCRFCKMCGKEIINPQKPNSIEPKEKNRRKAFIILIAVFLLANIIVLGWVFVNHQTTRVFNDAMEEGIEAVSEGDREILEERLEEIREDYDTAPDDESRPEVEEPMDEDAVNWQEEYLRILQNEGSPTLFSWGSTERGVISVSLKDLNNDGIPELIYSRINDGIRYDVLVYGVVDNVVVRLIYIEGIEHRVGAGRIGVYSSLGGGLMAFGGNGGGGSEGFHSTHYYIYSDILSYPEQTVFRREWYSIFNDQGLILNTVNSFFIDGISATEQHFSDEENRMMLDVEYFLTGSWEEDDITDISMTYEEVIAYLMSLIATGP